MMDDKIILVFGHPISSENVKLELDFIRCLIKLIKKEVLS